MWGKEGGQRSETGFALAEGARQSGLPVGMRDEVCELSDQERTQLCLGPRRFSADNKSTEAFDGLQASGMAGMPCTAPHLAMGLCSIAAITFFFPPIRLRFASRRTALQAQAASWLLALSNCSAAVATTALRLCI